MGIGYEYFQETGRARQFILKDCLHKFVWWQEQYYTELCERTREDALQLMIQHGEAVGCNAVINMRYDANEVMSGITEVLAYGIAVVVEKVNQAYWL